jgi:Family of unknown function (DUF6086)
VSQYFKVGGVSVWNPATTPAQLFYRTAGAMTLVARQPHGIVDLEYDEYDVDLPVYQDFVAALTRRYLDATHSVIVDLAGGFLPMAVAFLRAAGGDVPLLAETAAGDLEAARKVPAGEYAIEKATAVLARVEELKWSITD